MPPYRETNIKQAATHSHNPASHSGSLITASDLKALTPAGLFTNLFPVIVPAGSMGTIRSVPTSKAQKDEFLGRKQPSFYSSGSTLYTYGSGIDEFADSRFSPTIVTSETDRNFTKHLLRLGLLSFFRERGFSVRFAFNGFTVQDAEELIDSSENAFLHMVPQFNFQPYWVECVDGSVVFAFAIEPGTSTLPVFSIGTNLSAYEGLLQGLKLKLNDDGCQPGCPLYGRKGRTIGTFQGFASSEASLDCTCHQDLFDAVPIRVLDRGTSDGRPGAISADPGKELVIPGQLVIPTPSQRRVLNLFKEKSKLEKAAKVWLGTLTADGKVRSSALQVRYGRIQQFLARISGGPMATLSFQIPTGPEVSLQRIPLTVDEVTSVAND